jgi:hypothetical protein
MDHTYFKQRERNERAAAKQAANIEARRVHQQLAAQYAAVVRNAAEGTAQLEVGPTASCPTILGR